MQTSTMKVIEADIFTNEPKPNGLVLAIEDAITRECTRGSIRNGELERLRSNSERTAEMLGRLIATLHDTGKLSDSSVLEILGGGYHAIT